MTVVEVPLDYRIAKMELGPRDILVIKFNRILSKEIAFRLKEQMEKTLPNVRHVIIDDNVDFSILQG